MRCVLKKITSIGPNFGFLSRSELLYSGWRIQSLICAVSLGRHRLWVLGNSFAINSTGNSIRLETGLVNFNLIGLIFSCPPFGRVCLQLSLCLLQKFSVIVAAPTLTSATKEIMTVSCSDQIKFQYFQRQAMRTSS